jgi:serine/threonine protein kinase
MSKDQQLASRALSWEDGSAAWEALAECAGRFLTAWETGDASPELRDFLPASGTWRRMVLIELLKIDLEQRLQGRGPHKSIEQYLAEFPELAGTSGPPCDLVYQEFHARRAAGDTVSQGEYLDRFPGLADSLRRLFGFRAAETQRRAAAQPVKPDLKPGDTLEEFEILRILGEGAFARVFLAWQKPMQRRVALKISGRVSDEPQTLAQLDHPHIVRVYDQRLLPDGTSQGIYMEYLPGGNLQDLVTRVRETPPALRSGRLLVEVVDAALAARREPTPASSVRERLAHLPWPHVVCWLGAQLAAALDYAHAHHTLHRDLKPANILLTAEGLPKLVDFNISYSSKLEGASPAAFFGGSIAYMAPEHLEAFSPFHDRKPGEVDGRSDLYALGLVLWELLTGERPFPQEQVYDEWSLTLREMIEARRAGVPDGSLAQLPPSLPPGFREALLRCLHPDPDQRFATAGEFARELGFELDPEICHARERRTGRWHEQVRRHLLLAACVLGLLPNVVLSIVNVSYDWFAIVLPRLPEGSRVVFLGTLITLLKASLYAIGLGVGVPSAWPALRPLLSTVDTPALWRARRRATQLGDIIFWISIGAWVGSGVLFPAWLDFCSHRIHLRDYVHFFVSHSLCGLIAGTVSFFLSAFLVARVWYPRLLEVGPVADGDAKGLAALRERTILYGRLAVVIPFLAALTLGFGDPGFQPAFAGLAVLGFAMLAVTFRLSREIQSDLGALVRTVSPSAGPSVG